MTSPALAKRLKKGDTLGRGLRAVCKKDGANVVPCGETRDRCAPQLCKGGSTSVAGEDGRMSRRGVCRWRGSEGAFREVCLTALVSRGPVGGYIDAQSADTEQSDRVSPPLRQRPMTSTVSAAAVSAAAAMVAAVAVAAVSIGL